MKMNENSLKVFYDGTCPFCTFSARNIAKLDWFRNIDLIDANNEVMLEQFEITKEQALTRIQVVKNETYRAEGIDAIYLIVKKLPALWIFIPFLWISTKVGLGMRLYDWIARNRLIFPTPGYCPIQDPEMEQKKH